MDSTTTTTAAQVADVLGRYRFRWRTEDDLQSAVAQVLADAGIEANREVVLSPTDRIDLLADAVGIEVKVTGAITSVARQLQRYAASPDVDELVLVTGSARHRQLPATIGGLPLTVVSVVASGL